MAKRVFTRWAIVGEVGLYVGQCLTRADAIAEHVSAKYGTSRWVSRGLSTEQLAAWHKCRAKGDQAVKVSITIQ